MFPVHLPFSLSWRRSYLAAWWALLLCTLLLAPALAQNFPPLTGRIVDAANLLKPEERASLDAKLKAHEDKTSDQIVVATVPSLDSAEIEDYANRLFRHWQLGEKKTNNGVLLLVAPKERKVRIEVGYGLEGSLTDALSKVIITTAVAPQFKTGNFSGGVNAGIDAILSILTGDAEEWQRRAEVREDDASPIASTISFLIFLVFLYFVFRTLFEKDNSARMHRTRSGRWIPAGSSFGGSSWGSSSGGSSFSGGGGSSGGGGASGSW